MHPQERQELLVFRDQTQMALDSARRMLSGVQYAQAHEGGCEALLESTQALVARVEELVLLTDLILSGVEPW